MKYEPDAPRRGRHWRAVAAMFALNGGLFGIWASRIPAAKDLHELSHASLGTLLLLMAAGAICAFPIAGRFSDKLGAAQLTRVLGVLNAVALIGLALAPSVITLGVVLFFFGAFHGAMDVAMNAWGAEVERWAKRAQMSTYHAMWSLGAGLGAGSGYLAIRAEAGLLLHFLIAGGVLLAVTLVLGACGWRSEVSGEARGPAFSLPKGALVLAGLVAFCASMGEGAMADWGAIYLRDEGGAPEEWAAIGYTVFSVAMVVMRLLGGWVNRLSGPVMIARASGLIAAIGAGFVVLSPTVFGILVGFVLMGFGYALIIPLAFSRAANDPEIPPGQAIASVATFGYGGILLGPPIMGFVAAASSLKLSYGLLGVMALFVVVFGSALGKPR